jgi:hypothetical protein
MNKGVEILLARMESNPEEFNGEINRWGDLLQYYKTYLNPDDANALNEGINKTIQQRFTEKVMKELLDPKSLELEDVIKQYRATGISSVGQTQGGFTLNTTPQGHSTWATTTATGTISADSIMLGNTSINEATINQILQAHKEVRQKQTKPKRWWNKSIPELFGKK